MNPGYKTFNRLKSRERLDYLAAAADRIGTIEQAIEKDLWVCRVIDALFDGLGQRPKLFFKGGTSLSKGYDLIKRFSEDIDIVLSRSGLYIKPDEDPLEPGLSNKKRDERLVILKEKCSNHVLGRMRDRLAELLPMCTIEEDTDDADKMSLRVKYPSLLKADGYLKPWVKLECGARGALEPIVKRTIAPYIQEELGNRIDLATEGVTLISAERTFWEKALILHGIYCGFRDDNERRPGDGNLISRHYYDVAMMGDTKQGNKAMKDLDLLGRVRDYKQLMFRRGWEKLGEAKPGSVHLVPQDEIQDDLANDYEAMSGMMFGEAPEFASVLDQLRRIEDAINDSKSVGTG